MFDAKKFKIALIKRDKSISDIAHLIGVNVATVYRKINGTSDFFRDEIQLISDYLELSVEEKEKIFFAQKVTETQKNVENKAHRCV